MLMERKILELFPQITFTNLSSVSSSSKEEFAHTEQGVNFRMK